MLGKQHLLVVCLVCVFVEDVISNPTPIAPTASAGCGKATTLKAGPQKIQVNGKSRDWILRLPNNYNHSHPYKLYIGYHWLGGHASDVNSGGTDGDNWAYYGQWRQTGGNAIFVAPQGLNVGWANAGGEDITLTDDLLKVVENDLCVDTSHRFALGFSYGAGMTYSVACSRAKVFRAVTVYSGAQLSGCSGGNDPIAYMGVHGVSDPTCHIEGGRALRDRFVKNNGCHAESPPEPKKGSHSHIITKYSGCKEGYPVVWAAFDGGHDPGPKDAGGDGWQTWTSAAVNEFFNSVD